MTLTNLRIIRLTSGISCAVAVSYGYGWPLSFVTPIFAFMFLAMPVWIGGKMAFQLLLRLAFSLLIGMAISKYLLVYPLLCIPFYGLLFFYIYYNDTPSAPPMATVFMTLAVTMIPIMSFSGAEVAHVIALALFFNMAFGLFFAWLFHTVLPDTICSEYRSLPPPQKPPAAALPTEKERIRLAFVSTLVALSAVIIFFSLNLVQHSLAMIYICFMAGSPNTITSKQVMKVNATATCIGGIAIILAYNLLVAVPTYAFLIILTASITIIFSRIIFGGSPQAAVFSSGFTTFLVLLGTSTGVDKSASVNFYLRIAQVLFAGLFTIAALVAVEHLLRKKSWRIKFWTKSRS